MAEYYLKDDGTFVIKNYDQKPPFTSFLPGIAGKMGIPIWLYYVNRGQCVCSFGIGSKANSIMKFNSANVAYEDTALKGFRTFIRCGSEQYQPFFPVKAENSERYMLIRQNSLSIQETNPSLGLCVTIKYFVMPNESFGSLVRKVSIKNLSDKSLELTILDGIPQIIPYGVTTQLYNEMSNLCCSWADVYNLENSIPFYLLRSSMDDSSNVQEVDDSGYFYMSFQNGRLIRPICDPNLIFGEGTSKIFPTMFEQNSAVSGNLEKQFCANKYSCGFSQIQEELAPGESSGWVTLIGYADSPQRMNCEKTRILAEGYMDRKEQEAEQITETLSSDAETHTAVAQFDMYMRQCYLDNLLRGGYPYVLNQDGNPVVLHLFSRKHGDPERDYNFFTTSAEPYSQGNGNFRDVCQNRRNDVIFRPSVGNADIKLFGSLIQADGYNPLEIRPITFTVGSEHEKELAGLIDTYVSSGADEVRKICKENFTPGQFLLKMADEKIKLSISRESFLEKVLNICKQNIEAVFGEGFWSDHWTYILDLVKNYLRIYPENEYQLLFQENQYPFYDSPVFVLPRSEKYVLENGHVRQYASVQKDEEKISAGCNPKQSNWLKTKSGTVYQTSLFVKLMTLVANKFSSLDPEGMGIEMEGDKPGWNDALNGLPSLLGSGMPETFALKQLIHFLLSVLEKYKPNNTAEFPEELGVFINRLNTLLMENENGQISQFDYWDKAASERENYRASVRLGISGSEISFTFSSLIQILRMMEKKVDAGIQKAIQYGKGLPPTYFMYDAVEFELAVDENGKPVINQRGTQIVKVKNLKVKPLPAFLEGPARMMPTVGHDEAAALYHTVRNSDLYDKKLQMYKTSASIEQLDMKVGRIRAFTPGWLERESIFLHMEYKYLLAILESGLYREFYEEIKRTMIPFLSPEIYGRSILENCSFLVSSANPDSSLHGRGFVSRLSGSTAEALSMWVKMFIGEEIFSVKDGVLTLCLSPKLPAWFFDSKDEVSFQFLSHCKVTYHNPSQRDTFGENASRIVSLRLDYRNGKNIFIQGSAAVGDVAKDIRSGNVKSIYAEMEPSVIYKREG